VLALAFSGCPSPSTGEGEGEGAGQAGEGEGEGASEGEGEGEGPAPDGSCEAPFIASTGVNHGSIAAGLSKTNGTCGTDDGPEQVWSYTTQHDGSIVRATVHTDSVDVDVDVYARSDCFASAKGFELGCSAKPGDDTIAFAVPSAGSDVSIIVDTFQLLPPGDPPQPYTLTVAELAPLANGDACDAASTTSTCVAPDTCVNGHCGISTGPALCNDVTPVATNGTFTVVTDSPTDLPCAATPNGGEHAYSYVTNSANSANDVTLSNIGAIPVEIEIGLACDELDSSSCTSLTAAGTKIANLAGGTTLIIVAHAGGSGGQVKITETPHALSPGDPCLLGFDVCPTPTDCLGLPGQETCTTATTLAANASCDPTDTAHVCPTSTECLGVAGAETCTTPITLALGDPCSPGDTSKACPTSSACLVGGDSVARCIDAAAQTCANEITAALGENPGDTSAAFDGFSGSCSPPLTPAPEQAFAYTVQGAAVKLVAAVTGAFNGANDSFVVYIDRGTCGSSGAELACVVRGPTDPTTTASFAGLFTGDVVTIFVEDPSAGRFNLAISEIPILTLNPGDACTPGSDTAVCPQATSCLGGPAPNPFTCTTAHVGALNDACVAGSTDQICDVGLFCDNTNHCVTAVGATSATLSESISASDPTSTARLTGFGGETANLCTNTPTPGAIAFDKFHFENASGQIAHVNVDTEINCNGADTVMAAFEPSFDDDVVTAGCVIGNDDGTAGDLCSSFAFTIPAAGTADVVVWPFNAGTEFSYTFHYTSDVPVVLTAP
jgi:hypothetical protein